MGENFWLLVFIFFVLAPILERVLKGGKRPPPPTQRQRRPPQQRRLPQQRPQLPEPQGRQPQRTGNETATDILPPELWELLTGQKSPARVPPPSPEAPRRETQWDEEADHEEEERALASSNLPAPIAYDEDKEAAELLARRQRAADRPVDRSAPVVVSMETAPLPAAARHREFHRKIDKVDAKKVAPAMEAVQPARNIIADVLRDGSSVDIRRAILMKEVLGPPKGLEP